MASKIGLLNLTLFVVGAQIGPGIFALPQQFAPYGLYGLLSWTVVGMGAVVLALVFARLSLRVPLQTGGPHTYVQEAFGKPFWTFLIAWTYWSVSWVGTISVVSTCTGALEVLCGPWAGTTRLAAQCALFGLGLGLNALGAGFVSKSNAVAVAVKFLAIGAVVAWAFPHMRFEHLVRPSDLEPWKAFGAAGAVGLWGFVGLESATVHIDEIANPARSVPRALVLGTVAVVLVYIVSTTVVVAAYPPAAFSQDFSPFLAGARMVWGDNGAKAMAGLVVFVCLNALLAWMMLAAQVSLGAAQQGVFPAWFARKNRFGAPVFGLVTPIVLSLPFMVSMAESSCAQQIRTVIDLSVNGLIFVYGAAVVAWMWFLRQDPQRSVWDSLLAGGALAFCGGCLWISGIKALACVAAFAGSGAGVYAVCKRWAFLRPIRPFLDSQTPPL